MTLLATPHLQSIGLTTFRGLPAHILIVHAVVIFVPLAGLALIGALRPEWARRMGIVLPGLAVVAFLSVLAAMNAGGWLQDHVQNTALVQDHTRIAGQLWPFSAGVGLLSLYLWWQSGRAVAATQPETPSPSAQSGSLPVRVIVGVLSVILAVGSIVEVARIGESGARASWNGHFSQTSNHQG